MSARLRVGVVGVGRLGFHHARLLAARSDVALVGVCDSDTRRAAAVSRSLGTSPYEDLPALLASCEAMVVAAPATAHGRVGVAALSVSRHALIEKPLAATVAEAEALVHLAARQGVVLQAGHSERFNPSFLALAARCRAPRRISAVRLSRSAGAGDVNAALDLLVHDIDLACVLLGEPVVAVDGWVARAPDRVRARLTFAGGQVADLVAARGARRTARRWRVEDATGTHEADLLSGTPHEPLTLEHEAFLTAVRGRPVAAADGPAGLAAVRLAHRVVEAARLARARSRAA